MMMISEPSKTSVILKGEQVLSTIGIAVSKLLVSISNKDILIIENWSICTRVIESDIANT